MYLDWGSPSGLWCSLSSWNFNGIVAPPLVQGAVSQKKKKKKESFLICLKMSAIVLKSKDDYFPYKINDTLCDIRLRYLVYICWSKLLLYCMKLTFGSWKKKRRNFSDIRLFYFIFFIYIYSIFFYEHILRKNQNAWNLTVWLWGTVLNIIGIYILKPCGSLCFDSGVFWYLK